MIGDDENGTYMIERWGNQSLKRLVEGNNAINTKFLEKWNMSGERHSTKQYILITQQSLGATKEHTQKNIVWKKVFLPHRPDPTIGIQTEPCSGERCRAMLGRKGRDRQLQQEHVSHSKYLNQYLWCYYY